MVLKKPYVFIIKHFKLLHLFLSIFCVYILYKTNILLTFFNNYLESQESVVGQNIKVYLYNSLMFILPFLSLFVTIILLYLMLKKKKPYKFYLINMIINLFIIILFFYSNSFIGQMEIKIVDILNVRVIRDLLLIVLSLEGISLIILLVRSVGFDIKKFEFLSDLNDLELSQEDMEEIEIEFDHDSNESKRKRKRNLRYLKYSFRENKSFIVFGFIILSALIFYFIYSKITIYTFNHKEGEILNSTYYSYKVDGSYLVNTSYKGMKITDDYLLIIDLSIKKNSLQNKIITSNFKLQIGDNKYDSTIKYNKYITDLGVGYTNDEITNDYQNYLLVYEIPIDDIDKSMKLLYFENENSIKVKLKPNKYIKDSKEYNIGDEISIDETDIVKLNGYELSDRFSINYDYCIKDTCYPSIQYLVPTLNTNYDKVIIKINGEFIKNNNSKYNNFTNIFSSIGSIEYRIGDNIYSSSIQRITNIKKEEDNIYYYEVNKDILNSDSIKLNFTTRKCKYSYILK